MNTQIEWPALNSDDQQLLDLIEVVIANTPTAGHADHALYDFSRQLASARPAPTLAFRRALEERLMSTLTEQQAEDSRSQATPTPRSTFGRWRLVLAGGLVVIGLVVIAIMTYPPTRAWAQAMLARFGPFTFTTGPTLPEQALTATPEPPPTQTRGGPPPEAGASYQNVMTLEEAQQLVSFAILVPHYLPEGMQLASYSVMPESPGSVPDVSATYVGATNSDVLIIRQFPYAGESVAEFPIGDAPRTEVTVRGQSGLWVEEANLGLQPEGQLIQWSFLIWQEEREGTRFLLWMYTHTLSQAEMLKIAESLAP